MMGSDTGQPPDKEVPWEEDKILRIVWEGWFGRLLQWAASSSHGERLSRAGALSAPSRRREVGERDREGWPC